MPGFDETIPPPPRDPAEEAARLEKLRELEAKLPALEARARAAMSDTADREPADSDTAGSEVAVCNCDLDTDDCTDPVCAALRKGHADLLAQIENDPYHQARKEAFLRKLANGELAEGDIPPGENAEDCPKCATANLPYPWICKGHPDAYARAMAIAEGRDTDQPRLDEIAVPLSDTTGVTRSAEPAVGTAAIPDGASHIEIYAEGGWIRADALELAAKLARVTNERDELAREVAKLQNRGAASTWNRQADELARQAVRLGDYEAVFARIKAIAERWQYVPAKKDAARQLLAALDMRKARG